MQSAPPSAQFTSQVLATGLEAELTDLIVSAARREADGTRPPSAASKRGSRDEDARAP